MNNLPEFLTGERLMKSLTYKPRYSKEITEMSADKRLSKLSALRKMLCKQYLTTFDKVKITGISLIKSVNNNYWLLPQDRIRQC